MSWFRTMIAQTKEFPIMLEMIRKDCTVNKTIAVNPTSVILIQFTSDFFFFSTETPEKDFYQKEIPVRISYEGRRSLACELAVSPAPRLGNETLNVPWREERGEAAVFVG